mgnify:FL=1
MEFSPVYPLTILCDRYGGTYSGGAYTAWNRHYDDLPYGFDADDEDCAEFWMYNVIPVGRGTTPNDAVIDLERRLANGDEL